MLNTTYFRSLPRFLFRKHGVARIDAGLTNREVNDIERRFGFIFPPDLRAFLQFALPVGDNVPNWRDDPEEALWDRLHGPVDGILFDVEQSNFWLEAWGAKPASKFARRSVVQSAVDNAPKLIPVFSHRFVPAEPNEAGNPVFSVHQTDIICYGNDLADYFHNEFGVPLPDWAAKQPRSIQFWSDSLLWRD